MTNCFEKFGCACRVFLLLIGVLGLAFSCLTAISCDFVNGARNNKGGSAGLFIYEAFGSDTCDAYDPDIVSNRPLLQGSQAAAIIAPALAMAGIVVQLLDMCICNTCCVENLVMILYLCAVVCQGCTFLVLEQCAELAGLGDASCGLGAGAIFAILAMICYFVVSVLICCTPRPEPCLLKDRSKNKEDDAEKGEAATPTPPPTPDAAAAPAAPIQAQTH